MVDYFKFPENAKRGDEIELKIGIENVGVAPMYDKIPLYIKLKGENVYEFTTQTDITKILPGKKTERFVINIPDDIVSGIYKIEVGIYGLNYPMVYFATDAQRDGNFYVLGELEID